jgi:glycosyltransferase involved in cell wall biosynthesis
MNIWLISKYASPPNYSKVPSRLFYLANEFKQLGNKVKLFTSDSNHLSNFPETSKVYNEEIQRGIDLLWIKTKKYSKTASLDRILSWLDFELKIFAMPLKGVKKPDIVIISSLSIFTILYGYYLKRKFKSFLVFEIRDIWPLTLIEEGGFSKFNPLAVLIGAIEKFGYRNADLIVGTMPKLNLHVENRISANKPVFCSPLGFESSNYSDEDLTTNNPFAYLVSEGKVIVGYAGSMGITNGLELFMATIKNMTHHTNIHFLLVGSGDLKAKYQSELTQCNNVTFLPRIEQDQVKYFLAICDVLYLSTINSIVWKYGQSMNKVVEYMLAAKPIIASYSGYPSMINEAECGIFVNSQNTNDLEQAFLKYANLSKDERMQIGQNGRKWIFEHRTYSRLAKEYLEKVKECMIEKDKAK